jgi:uncharacterized membrane-anchored protein
MPTRLLKRKKFISTRQRWHAREQDVLADVDTAAAIVGPTNIAMRKRLMIALPDVMNKQPT